MMPKDPIFAAYSEYYDLLYQDKDYEIEANYVDSLLRVHAIRGRSVLELGSGTGKHGKLIASSGYQVHGIEQSKDMLARVAQGDGFTVEEGDICKTNLFRKFDAAIALFHVVSYQISNQSILELLQRTKDHLNEGGLFLFDVWYSPAVYKQRPMVRVKRVSTSDIEIMRIAEPVIFHNENRVDVQYTIFVKNLKTNMLQKFSELHSMRHFSLPEIKMLASMTGFEFLEAKEFLTAADPSDATWGVCVVLRRCES
jgi:SAM-dependent methyltransferase